MATAQGTPSRRPIVLLALGTVVGVVLAASGLIGAGPNRGAALPADAVARVNGELIAADEFERTVTAMASDSRNGVDAAQRRHVLDRLIDEELLIQRGLELGLARHDRKVRGDLAAAVIAAIVAEHEDVQPSDSELAAFYDQHRDFFTSVGRLAVRQIFCRVATSADDAPALQRAQDAVRRLRTGEPFGTVQAALGDRELSPLPQAPLPAAKLIDYIGPTALQVALGLAAGEVSEPVRSSAGYHVLQVVERQPDSTPPLAEITPQVLAEFRRQAGERALRSYLDELRGRAEIAVSPPLQ